LHDVILYLDPDSPLNLQNQIRQKLVDGILNGAFPPGTKLPSSRKLAEQLDVARNTVVLAYQQLIAEGYLVSQQRSGIFVNKEMLDTRVGFSGTVAAASSEEAARWRRAIKRSASENRAARDLPDWSKYPYPFIDGKFDSSLFPLAEWREASRLALSVADVRDWSIGSGDADDPMLLAEIRTKILPRRGIQARSDEILITLGTQHSLYLVSELLADKSVTAVMEEPGNTEMRQLLERRGARIVQQEVDEDGLVVDAGLEGADLVYVTPSHQIPTAVAMSQARRQALLEACKSNDFLIIEDDYECETSYLDRPAPALRSMDSDGRVIYVASFSKVLAPGIRLGFIVANAAFIRRARSLRRAMLNHPPLNNQRTAAFFLSLGHYDALMLRMARVFQERRTALRDALNFYRSVSIEISPEVGGTTWWVRLPDDFNVDYLASEAEREGILVEPVRHYYADASKAQNCFRMGVTSIPIERIRPGVVKLTELIRNLASGRVEHLDSSSGDWLVGDELQAAMSDRIILYNVVYGVPCTIELHADGRMVGRAGYANEDCDVGRWWVDGERWHRQWEQWVYGEAAAYFVVIDGDRVKWFNADRQIVDAAFIRNFEPAS
jgi:GntR family transcriptional regulator / MocR family aminotransferase